MRHLLVLCALALALASTAAAATLDDLRALGYTVQRASDCQAGTEWKTVWVLNGYGISGMYLSECDPGYFDALAKLAEPAAHAERKRQWENPGSPPPVIVPPAPVVPVVLPVVTVPTPPVVVTPPTPEPPAPVAPTPTPEPTPAPATPTLTPEAPAEPQAAPLEEIVAAAVRAERRRALVGRLTGASENEALRMANAVMDAEA